MTESKRDSVTPDSRSQEPAAATERAELVAHFRDPSTSTGLLPQWIRDRVADDLEERHHSVERLRRFLGSEEAR